MEISEFFVPKINPKCSWQQFDKGNHLICVDGDSEDDQVKLIIGEELKHVLELIDGERNIKEITEELNLRHKWNLDSLQLSEIFNSQLTGYGILQNEDFSNNKIKGKDKYIWLKVTLIPSKFVKKISSLFTFLFSKKVFYTLFISSLLMSTYLFFTNLELNDIYRELTPRTIFAFLAVNYISLFLHEFGHSSACKKFGSRPGKIGFGFYLFTPVFFSDVSDAWRLTREERLIVDLGGIYFQLILISLLNVYSIITSNVAILVLSSMIGFGIVFNLNPFLRYDGYWALSDALNIVNLRDKARHATGLFLGWIIGKNKTWKPTKRNILLIFYGLAMLVMIILFIFYMVINQSNSILYLPQNLYNLFQEIIKTGSNLDFDWYKRNFLPLIPALGFYVILIVMLYRILKKRIRKLGLFN